jgi:hypothetical protein
MSASAAESTDCTGAALGAVERLIDSRLVVRCATYFAAINNLTCIKSLRLPVHVGGRYTVSLSCIPKNMHHTWMHSMLQISSRHWNAPQHVMRLASG